MFFRLTYIFVFRIQSSRSSKTTESGMWGPAREVTKRSRDNPAVKFPLSNGLALQQNEIDYLPQFIARRMGDEIPVITDSCKIKAKFNATSDAIRYLYTVSWMEDGPVHPEIDHMTSASRSRVSSTHRRSKKAGKEAKRGGGDKRVATTPTRKCCASKIRATRPSLNALKSEHSTASVKNREINVEVGEFPVHSIREIHKLWFR